MIGTLKGLLSAIFALGTRRPEKEGGRRECEQPGISNLIRLDGRIRFDQIFVWRKYEWQIFDCGVKGQVCSMSTSRPAMPPTTMRGEVEELERIVAEAQFTQQELQKVRRKRWSSKVFAKSFNIVSFV